MKGCIDPALYQCHDGLGIGFGEGPGTRRHWRPGQLGIVGWPPGGGLVHHHSWRKWQQGQPRDNESSSLASASRLPTLTSGPTHSAAANSQSEPRCHDNQQVTMANLRASWNLPGQARVRTWPAVRRRFPCGEPGGLGGVGARYQNWCQVECATMLGRFTLATSSAKMCC